MAKAVSSLVAKGPSLVKEDQSQSYISFTKSIAQKFIAERLQVNYEDVITGFIDSATPKYHLFVRYAKVELAPPTPADIPQIRSGIQKLLTGFRTGKWKETTVKDAWLNSLVTAEVVFWFFIGECIGKRSIVGYHV